MSRSIDLAELERLALWHMHIAADYRLAASAAKSRSERMLMHQLEAAAIARSGKIARRAQMMRREREAVAALKGSHGVFLHMRVRP